MWAQLISMRLKPGYEDDLPRLIEQFWATEQPDSGQVRSMAMRDQNDPNRFFMMVVFETEEKARAREADPRRQKGLQAARAIMAEILTVLRSSLTSPSWARCRRSDTEPAIRPRVQAARWVVSDEGRWPSFDGRGSP
jgi:quinol monooxygenase YgiN